MICGTRWCVCSTASLLARSFIPPFSILSTKERKKRPFCISTHCQVDKQLWSCTGHSREMPFTQKWWMLIRIRNSAKKKESLQQQALKPDLRLTKRFRFRNWYNCVCWGWVWSWGKSFSFSPFPVVYLTTLNLVYWNFSPLLKAPSQLENMLH